MKKLIIASALVASLGLVGCNQALINLNNGITNANNALANLAANDIPTACGIIKVAEGYFAQLKSLIPAAAIADEHKAEIVVNGICANPPANISSAFATLMASWVAIQNDTTVPATTTN